MAWTTPKTWASGYVVLAADLNTHLRDNISLTAPAVMTSAGDIIYASGANTPARLAKDTNSTRSLTNTGSSNIPAWAQVALATGVSGTLPVGSGGTGADQLDDRGHPYRECHIGRDDGDPDHEGPDTHRRRFRPSSDVGGW